jgi:hypothetical protein
MPTKPQAAPADSTIATHAIRPGFGYWSLDRHPFGGEFHRANANGPQGLIVRDLGDCGHPGWVTLQSVDGKSTVAVQRAHLDPMS